MEFMMKLPQNKKEFALFLGIVSVLSVNLIAPLITCFEMGFTLHTWGTTLRIIPYIWICVIVLVIFTHKPAQYFTSKLVSQQDSFYAQTIINILCTVFMMSMLPNRHWYMDWHPPIQHGSFSNFLLQMA